MFKNNIFRCIAKGKIGGQTPLLKICSSKKNLREIHHIPSPSPLSKILTSFLGVIIK
jgi:hypothetical protein